MKTQSKIPENIICPVCLSKFKDEKPLEDKGSFAACKNNHTFDRAKQGYINLALSATDKSGDNKNMVLSRTEFLNKGYYDILAEKLCEIIKNYNIKHLTDACCGEGYFTNKIKNFLYDNKKTFDISAFDLSKPAIINAAKHYKDILFFVANISSIPIESNSVNCLLHLFAPVNSVEFCRILSPDGVFIHVMPAKRHLWQLKEILYESPYENDENTDILSDFNIAEQIKINSSIKIQYSEDIIHLFEMTPYAFRTPKQGKTRLESLTSIETDIEFIINICAKKHA